MIEVLEIVGAVIGGLYAFYLILFVVLAAVITKKSF